ncbi:hypothetical protein EXIGLDRAFT_721074 [Exidia glandulosa HHB12029]|uniref:Protein kinase domain-containing protein n=1 Tax=Exidia glandulosa HHB12029 TaxID=1314781 RepID=A0A165FZE7_EXIGL|nr:hypothetical protein EXIGLDRAFT_721074 [Exidia glandulosa HHB12029]
MSMTTRNPLQDDYVAFPKATRPQVPGQLELWTQATADGVYDLNPVERGWVAIQPWLLTKGYALRPRYVPGWKPRWIGTDIYPGAFEDSVSIYLPNIIDATQLSSGRTVAIKWVPHAENTRSELEIMRFLSSPELKDSDDPRNHCNPVLDTFTHPDNPNGIFIVTPWLAGFVFVPIDSVCEVVDMLSQLLEGLIFMHEHNVAHRDCTGMNIMQDVRTLFPGLRTHPQRPCYSENIQIRYDHIPRSRASVKYYFIDFGISARFEGPGPHLVTGTACRDRTAPELSATVPYDPFKLDVYLLGNHFLKAFLAKFENLEFLRPLLVEMTQKNPSDRPTAQQAYDKLKAIAREPFGLPFRWRIRPREAEGVEYLIEEVGSAIREISAQARTLLFGGSELSFGR